jgi:hypothetical protein
MTKFRRKPVEVQAWQWQPGVVIPGVTEYKNDSTDAPCRWTEDGDRWFPSIEGEDAFLDADGEPVRLRRGDWVVIEPNQPTTVYDKNLFHEVFERVEEE